MFGILCNPAPQYIVPGFVKAVGCNQQ